MIWNLLLMSGGAVGVYLAFEWGTAALTKYKKDNDLT